VPAGIGDDLHVRTLAFVLPVLLGAGLASAEEPEIQLDGFGLAPIAWRVEAVAGTAHDRGEAAAQASALAEVRFTSPVCDLVALGGAFEARAEDRERQVSAEQWASFCMAGNGLPRLGLGHRLEWDVRPALSAPLTVPAAVYRRETLSLDASVLTWIRGRHVLELGVSRWRLAFAPGDAASHDEEELSVEADFFRWVRRAARAGDPDLVLEALSPGLLGFLETEPSPLYENHSDIYEAADRFALRAVRAAGIPLGRRLWVDADVGWAQGSVWAFGAGDARVVETATGGAALRFGAPRARASIGARRDLWPSIAQDLVVDDRVVAQLDLAPDRHTSLSLRGFAARTTIIDVAGEVTHATGGGELVVRHDLGRALELVVGVEVARSFYARLDGTGVPAPTWAGRGWAALAVRFGD
jgi:hypothetical protein